MTKASDQIWSGVEEKLDGKKWVRGVTWRSGAGSGAGLMSFPSALPHDPTNTIGLH
jgi:hypothetical protein